VKTTEEPIERNGFTLSIEVDDAKHPGEDRYTFHVVGKRRVSPR